MIEIVSCLVEHYFGGEDGKELLKVANGDTGRVMGRDTNAIFVRWDKDPAHECYIYNDRDIDRIISVTIE